MVVPTRAPMVLAIKKGDAAATAKAMGTMSAVAAVIELFVNPVIGKLSDQYGRTPFMMGATLVNFVLHGLVSVFPSSLPMQFVDRMISGAMIFGYAAPVQASLADLFATNPQKLGVMATKAMQYFGIGCVVGPFIGSKLGGAKSFAASALTFLACCLYVNTTIDETLTEDKKIKFKFSDVNPVAFLKLFKARTTTWLTITSGLQSFGDYVNIYDINNLFMIKVLKYGPPQIGNFAMTVGLSQVAGGVFSAKLIDKAGLRSATAFSNFMWALGMAMMGTARNTQQAFTALFIWTFGHNRANPVGAYLQQYGAEQGMGRGAIIAAQGNFHAYIKIMIPLLFSNMFAWATSDGRNMPGLPYFVICGLTALAQSTFQVANPVVKRA
jgi:MFS family permease